MKMDVASPKAQAREGKCCQRSRQNLQKGGASGNDDAVQVEPSKGHNGERFDVVVQRNLIPTERAL
jgi:hypothetical protein